MILESQKKSGGASTTNHGESPPIFVVDWDGTCTEDTWPVQGEWLPGAIDALRILLKHGRVRIFSARLSPYKFGLDAKILRSVNEQKMDVLRMRMFLDDAGLHDVEIHDTRGKPSGTWYIDNRAVEFKGSWDKVLETVLPGRVMLDAVDPPYGFPESELRFYGIPTPARDRILPGGTLRVDGDDLLPWQESIAWGLYPAGWVEEAETVLEDDLSLESEADPFGPHGAAVRAFTSGATRDTEGGKFDYEGFLSPSVLVRYAEFMHKNRVQKNGELRDSDNWQKGIPLDVYMKSLFRHFMEVWLLHRDGEDSPIEEDELQEALCALMFNAMGYLHETLKEESA